MRISDWSSDVCSSDLRCQEGGKLLDGQSRREKMNGLGYQLLCGVCAFAFAQPALARDSGPDQAAAERSAAGSVSTSEIVDRERVGSGQSGQERLDKGGGRHIKKKQNIQACNKN